MSNQEILDYIKQEFKKGVSKQEILNKLIKSGWQKIDIDEAFSLASESSCDPNPVEENVYTTLLSPIELLKEAWSIYTKRFGTFIGILLAFLVIYIISVLVPIFALKMANSFASQAILSIISIIIQFFLYLVLMFPSLALIYTVKDRSEKIGVMEAYRRAGSKLFSYIWTNIIIMLITFGGACLIVVPAIIIGMVLKNSYLLEIIKSSKELLVFIPGLFFVLWAIFANYVFVAENEKGMRAFLKSKEYTKGNLNNIVVRILFIAVIALVISYIFAILNGLFLAQLPDSAQLQLIASMIFNIILGIFIPLPVIYNFLMYENIKAIRGEFVFSPSKTSKIVFSLIATFGFAICTYVLGLNIYLLFSLIPHALQNL